MIVYKFGGSTVNNPAGIIKLGEIVQSTGENLVIVVSAFGKTTNSLEKVVEHYFNRSEDWYKVLDRLKFFHFEIIKELFPKNNHTIYSEVQGLFDEISARLGEKPGDNFDYEYDQIVLYGELWATKIVNAYLVSAELPSNWIDIRYCLITDDRYRDANVDWHVTERLVKEVFCFKVNSIYLTQGFIGGTERSLSTTLGREGSDYTAAIIGNILNAEKVIIWKDVPGVLNCDPKHFSNAERLEEISYQEAIELAFFGAKVIHPKTIKPLFNKKIPLWVKSAFEPENFGTLIHSVDRDLEMIPVYVKKTNQILISILPRDYSFIIGENLGKIFGKFNAYHIKVNLIQNSAISISVCIDNYNPG
ncbi:MAG: aspartate kinase, partial [Bacteroidetes bacterium]|nr:aspartate kinase [Bacteroidota bacterium]